MSRADSSTRSLARTASVFAALGDRTRLDLLVRLGRNGPTSITGLAVRSPVTRQAITKHLRVLESAGVIRGERRGREHVWSVRPDALDDVRRGLDLVAAQWESALDRLRAHIDR